MISFYNCLYCIPTLIFIDIKMNRPIEAASQSGQGVQWCDAGPRRGAEKQFNGTTTIGFWWSLSILIFSEAAVACCESMFYPRRFYVVF
jgi:hypothetical protein